MTSPIITSGPRTGLARFFPILGWIRHYNSKAFVNDIIATAIVFVMLVPQALAYAMAAGLPPVTGLYACLLPAFIYAALGSSMMLSVGPTALIALITSSAASHVAQPGSPEYLAAAIILAFLTGIFLMIMGALRLGFLTNLLSRSVVSGFMTGCALLIASKQIKYLIGVPGGGDSWPDIAASLAKNFGHFNPYTAALSVGIFLFVLFLHFYLRGFLLSLRLREQWANLLARMAPMIVILASAFAVAVFGLGKQGVELVGNIPQGLPNLTLPAFDLKLWLSLSGSAFLIALLGFVESISIAQAYAAKRKESVDPNQELLALGASSLASSLTGGCPVTGSFSRSAVNFHAGAETPLVGPYKAIGIAIVTCFFTPLLSQLPMAVLAIIIIMAVVPLTDFKAIRRAWVYSKREFTALMATIAATLILGVEPGLTVGVVLSILIHLHATSRPYFAVVGLVPGTQYFRDAKQADVVTGKDVVSVRVDESLYFANARFLEDMVYTLIAEHPQAKHLVLMCASVNHIDISALESLSTINQRLKDIGVSLHLSEVKEPIMDRLKRTRFLDNLTGQVFDSQYAALKHLDYATVKHAEGLAQGLGPAFF
jgi:SulP family sulfate permease